MSATRIMLSSFVFSIGLIKFGSTCEDFCQPACVVSQDMDKHGSGSGARTTLFKRTDLSNAPFGLNDEVVSMMKWSLLVLAAGECCGLIRPTGLNNPLLMVDYRRNGEVNGRPIYVEEHNYFAIWYDGDIGGNVDWIIGRVEDVNQGLFNTGYVLSNQQTACPAFGRSAHESDCSGGWIRNQDAGIRCVQTVANSLEELKDLYTTN